MKIFIMCLSLFYVILNSLIVEKVVAQEFNPCYNSPCTEPWNEFSSSIDDQGLTQIKYKVHWRICNGQIECVLEIGDMTNIDYFTTGSNHEIDFNAAKALAEFDALFMLIGQLIATGITIPDCPSTIPFIQFYTARCGVWVKCSFPISNEPETCDDCWTGNHPTPYPHGGKSYVDIYKWQPCGTICCKKEFSICKGYSMVSTYNQYIIKDVSRGPAPGATCSEQGTCHDWKTGFEIQCQDGCQGDGN